MTRAEAASASVAPAVEYCWSSRWACSHQRALWRISSTSAGDFDPHLLLDELGKGRHRAAGDLGERRPLVAEDPRVAVLVGGERAVGQDPREDRHRVLGPGYSGYDSIRSKRPSSSVRSTSKRGTNAVSSSPTTTTTGRSFERKLKPV